MSVPLHIMLDARCWTGDHQTGIERYISLLLEALWSASSRHDIVVHMVLMAGEREHFPAKWGSRLPLEFSFVESADDSEVDHLVVEHTPHLFHATFGVPRLASMCPLLYTLHDAGRYLFPHLMTPQVRDVDSPRLIHALQQETLSGLITVSESSLRDIVRLLPIGKTPCWVVPNFVGEDFREASGEPVSWSELQSSLKIPGPFLLAVGVFSPTKNIPKLCDAFHIAKRRYGSRIPETLVLVGRLGWEPMQFQENVVDVIVTGHVSEATLAGLYSTARGLIFPSLYEGFGIPILEAISCGCPVLCSKLPVFKEVGDSLVRQVDCTNLDEFAAGIDLLSQTERMSSAAVVSTLTRFTAAVAGALLMEAYSALASRRE